MAEPHFDVTAFGELLLRLSVPSGRRLETTASFDVYPAGAEANVISLLARLNRRTQWAGALPKNPLGRLAAGALRAAGVDTKGIIWKRSGRLGTYYVELGVPPRGTQVTYDREHSCTSRLKSDDIDWEYLLETRVIHLSGITPALSDSCREIVFEAIQRARKSGIQISFDVNYRHKLWSEAEASKTLASVIQGVDLLFCSQADAIRLFACKGTMHEVAQSMLELSQAKYAVISFGEQGAMLWNGIEWLHELARSTQIVDRLGAGDALAAGVIDGLLDGDLAKGVRYGVTLAALALGQSGDMVVTTREELEILSEADSTLSR
jgi:2-dehydro-3-deoxygluconokinase